MNAEERERKTKRQNKPDIAPQVPVSAEERKGEENECQGKPDIAPQVSLNAEERKGEEKKGEETVLPVLSLDQKIELVSKVLTLATRLGLFVGAFCVVLYLLKIGHLPQDLSIGDGLMFLIVAASFGIIYILFTFGGFPLIIILERLPKSFNFWSNLKKLDFAQALLAILSTMPFLCIVFALASQEMSSVFLAILVFLCELFYYLGYIRIENKISANKSSNPQVNLDVNSQAELDVRRLRNLQIFGFATISLLPLFLTPIFNPLLDSTMRLAQIQVENSIIYVKKPYSSLIPKSLSLENRSASEDYTAFKDVTILFRGIGKTTVISFRDGDSMRKLEIPNDHLIIENPWTSTYLTPK